MLEQTLIDLTKAINANTEALKKLASTGSPVSASIEKAPEMSTEPLAKAKVEQIKPDKAEVVTAESTPESVETSQRTMQDIMDLVSDSSLTRNQLVDVLAEHDAKKLPDLDKQGLNSVYAALAGLVELAKEAA